MLGFLGGTGPEGRGLALRLALAGHDVLIGSRDLARAQESAREIRTQAPEVSVRGSENLQVAQEAAVIFITVPFAAQRALLDPLQAPLAGKIVVSTTVPLAFSQGRARTTPVEEGSAALQAQSLLPHSRVVAAFQNISAVELLKPDVILEGDVVVCADDASAKERVMRLAEQIPALRAVDGGPLENAAYVEGLTALLLNINRIYKGSHSMVKITGLREKDQAHDA